MGATACIAGCRVGRPAKHGAVMLRAMLALWGLAFCLSARAQFIIVTDTGAASASTCTVAQAINAANGANSVNAASYGSITPAGNCSGAVAGQNVIVFNGWPTITLSGIDNYWYGPNALPPIASQIFIGAVSGYSGATLAASHTGDPTPTTANAFRFFYVSGGLAGELPAGKLILSGLTLKAGYAKGGRLRIWGRRRRHGRRYFQPRQPYIAVRQPHRQ